MNSGYLKYIYLAFIEVLPLCTKTLFFTTPLPTTPLVQVAHLQRPILKHTVSTIHLFFTTPYLTTFQIYKLKFTILKICGLGQLGAVGIMLFNKSTPWANSFSKSPCPYVFPFVLMFVCPLATKKKS